MRLQRCICAGKAGSSKYTHVFPRVYDRKPHTYPVATDERGFGWILMAFLPRVALDPTFTALEAEEKERLLEELAAIFSGIQRMSCHWVSTPMVD
jgi:hypothetical protein